MDSGAHGFAAYVIAVLTASLSFVLLTTIHGLLGGALSSVYPMSERIFQFAVMGFFVFLIVGLITFVAAWLPVMLVYKIARRFSISGVWYYVLSGGLAGFALGSLVYSILPAGFSDLPEVPPVWRQVLNLASFSVPSGVIGGFVFWLVLGRFAGRSEATT